LEFFGVIQLFEFLCFPTLLLTFTAFSLLISSLAAFNSCSRCLIRHSCCFICFWYLHDIQSQGMLLSAKLGLEPAVYVEATATVVTIYTVCYKPTASNTLPSKITRHNNNISILYYISN
jgi:hypothetical protein